MKLPTNRERADWANIALDVFADETGMQDEDREIQLSDMICNLMHFCDVEQSHWELCVAQAQDHYREEVRDERRLDEAVRSVVNGQ
jgi:hypothetical protein